MRYFYINIIKIMDVPTFYIKDETVVKRLLSCIKKYLKKVIAVKCLLIYIY